MLATLVALSVVVERLVEWVFGTPFDKLPSLQPYRWLLMYVAAAMGIAISLTFDLDMLSELGLAATLLGQVLTGVVIGGGSNFVHDILTALQGLEFPRASRVSVGTIDKLVVEDQSADQESPESEKKSLNPY